MVRAQLALGDGDLIGLEEARPIDVGSFEVRAADALNRLGTIEQLVAGMVSEMSRINEDAVGEIVALRGGNEGIDLTLRDVVITPKELTLDGGK